MVQVIRYLEFGKDICRKCGKAGYTIDKFTGICVMCSTKAKRSESLTVNHLCPHCGGEMRYLDVHLPVKPPVYPHECVCCEYQETLGKIYPYKEVREISS